MFKSAEIVGPLRVLNSYIGENMLPDIVKGKGVYCVDNLENLKRKAPMVSTSLDLLVRQLPGQVDNQKPPALKVKSTKLIVLISRPLSRSLSFFWQVFLVLEKVELFVNWLVLVGA